MTSRSPSGSLPFSFNIFSGTAQPLAVGKSSHRDRLLWQKLDFFVFFFKSSLKTVKPDIYYENGSGYSAAWFSAFDWGSKGPEFESPYPDHFFAPNGQKTWSRQASLHAPQVRFIYFDAWRAKLASTKCASYFCVLDTPEACKTQSAS